MTNQVVNSLPCWRWSATLNAGLFAHKRTHQRGHISAHTRASKLLHKLTKTFQNINSAISSSAKRLGDSASSICLLVTDFIIGFVVLCLAAAAAAAAFFKAADAAAAAAVASN